MRRARHALNHESGQSLVVVAISMFVIVAIAVAAIDVAAWYQKRHAAQVTADAAALAAANYMANGGVATTATITATSYASSNSLPISASNVSVDTTHDQVTVTVPTAGPNFFANAVGIGSPAISATAVASWKATQASQCPQQSSNLCYVAFATDPSSAGVGVYDNANNTQINGGVHSNCNVTNAGNSNTAFNGTVTYGNGSGCGVSTNKNGNPSASQDASALCFPIDYSGLTPNPGSCGGTDVTPGMSATSSYCTVTITSSGTYTIPTSGGYLTPGVYCDTTTGTVAVSGSVQAGGNGITVIAQSFSMTSAGTLAPYQSAGALANNHLVLYQYVPSWNGWTSTNGGCSGSSYTGTLLLNGNTSFNLNGYIFAPCAQVTFTANNAGMTGFLEAYDVQFEGASMTGDGPTSGSTGAVTLAPGSDLLAQ